MSERDDTDDLLDDLADTLEALQRELPAGGLAPRPPRPSGLTRRERQRGRRPRPQRDTDRSRDTTAPRNDEQDRLDDRTGDHDRDRGRSRRKPRSEPDTGSQPPRIPGPREFLQFTEEYTIPTLIAMLEATIKSLELLRAVLRVAGGRGLPDPTGLGRSRRSGRSRGRDVVGDAGRRALDSLDTVLDDIQDAIEGKPTDPRARDLLGEARDLRAEIDDMIAGRPRDGGAEDADGAEATSATDATDATDASDGHDGYMDDAASRSGASGRRSGGVTIDVGDVSGPTTDDGSSTDHPDEADRGNDASADDASADDASADDAGVDVDAELDTIKQEMGKTDDTTEGDRADDSDGGDGNSSSDSGSDSSSDSGSDSSDAP